MQFEFIVLIVLFGYLRNNLQTKTLYPQWDKVLFAGLMVSIGLLIIGTTVKSTQAIMPWIAHALFFSIIYLVITKKEFKPALSIIYAIIPLVAINFIEDVVKLISFSFYDNWANYFDTAGIFAFIWLVAMLIINRKQRKALEKEQLKTAEKDKEVKITESLKAALEVQVAERTHALTLQKEELQKTINELNATQSQLIQSEKMASLGELTAGIAHEIQNPLNFVNNFSEVNAELIDELTHELEKGKIEEAMAIAKDIKDNEQKINHHGKRADAIVKGMLQHSRSSTGIKEPTDINQLADEYLRLAYHGLRAKDKTFNASMKTDFDSSIGEINIIPQDIGRVILNLITNAFYAVTEKKKNLAVGSTYDPIVTVSTKKEQGKAKIKVHDNGNGVPSKVIDKIFQPFFTTKPTGQGTGLGLSMSYDIVTKGHGGELKVDTKEGTYTEFTIILPL
jgi:signal transduction histidine kinase